MADFFQDYFLLWEPPFLITSVIIIKSTGVLYNDSDNYWKRRYTHGQMTSNGCSEDHKYQKKREVLITIVPVVSEAN